MSCIVWHVGFGVPGSLMFLSHLCWVATVAPNRIWGFLVFGSFPQFCRVVLCSGDLLIKKDCNERKIITSPWRRRSTEDWVQFMMCCRGLSVTCFSHCILTFSYIGSPRHARDFVCLPLRYLMQVWKHHGAEWVHFWYAKCTFDLSLHTQTLTPRTK